MDDTLAKLLQKVVKTEDRIQKPTTVSGVKVGEVKPVETIKIRDLNE